MKRNLIEQAIIDGNCKMTSMKEVYFDGSGLTSCPLMYIEVRSHLKNPYKLSHENVFNKVYDNLYIPEDFFDRYEIQVVEKEDEPKLYFGAMGIKSFKDYFRGCKINYYNRGIVSITNPNFNFFNDEPEEVIYMRRFLVSSRFLEDIKEDVFNREIEAEKKDLLEIIKPVEITKKRGRL